MARLGWADGAAVGAVDGEVVGADFDWRGDAVVGGDHDPVAVVATIDGSTHSITLTTRQGLSGMATGWFTSPVAWVELDPAELAGDGDVELLGFAFTQFALPVVAGADLAFDFAPAPNLHSPSAVLPLLVRRGDVTTLLAPVTNPHEQVITVAGGRLRWGWHGDLDDVPAGFATELRVYEGASAGEVLDRWGTDVTATAGSSRRPPGDDPLTSHLSYWTDNGAAYWYRTEPGLSIAESVARTVEALRADGVPIHAVELDSWFYPHATNRPIAEIGYPEEVPPTGMDRWEPRPDAFDEPAGEPDGLDAIERFAHRLDRPPLVLHARHVDPTSSYLTDDAEDSMTGWWVEELAAQSLDPTFFRRWFDDAVRWGATCIEQDWMLMYWFGLRSLRAVPGRAMTWQRALNEHARATDIDLLWCMATPADLIAAAGLDRVVAVRTCDDYRFADDPALLWTWFLTVNRLVAPLGLTPFKDCFFSRADVADDADAIDGDPHAELEALLSAMSTGPVGIGDRLGHTDRGIVLRTCDDDGRLRRPDHPIGLIDDCLFGAPARGDRLAWATTSTTRNGDTWTYVVAINTSTEHRTIADAVEFAELGLAEEHLVYDWRERRSVIADRIHVELAPRDWALFVCCPIVEGTASIGDPDKYVTVV
jgi:hypothetical protein